MNKTIETDSTVGYRIDRNVKPEDKLNKESEYVIHEDVKIGDSNLKMGSTSQKTIADIVKEGKNIFKKVKAAGVSVCDEIGKNNLFNKLKTEHKEFMQALPIPFKWMVLLDEFSSKVLRNFLKCNPQLFWKTEEDWMNAMAGYITDLFREKNPHMDESRIKAYRQNIFDSFKKDSKDFKEKYEISKKEVEDLEKEVQQTRKNRLKRLLEERAKSKKTI